jgi:hypothetical protein
MMNTEVCGVPTQPSTYFLPVQEMILYGLFIAGRQKKRAIETRG